MKKQLWVILLAVVLVLGLSVFGTRALADDEPTPEPEYNDTVEGNGMTLKKNATVKDDGTYIIDLEAYATGEVTITEKVVPADIVLVLDVSGSMNDSMDGATSYLPGNTYTVQQVYNARTNYNYYFKINGEYKGRADNIEIDRKQTGTENQYTIQVDHVRNQSSGTTHSNENVLTNQNGSNSVTVYKTANNSQPVTMTVNELLGSYETTDYYYPHRGRHGNNNTQTTVYEKINHVNLVNTISVYSYRIAGVTDNLEGADEEGYVPATTTVLTYTASSTKLAALKNAVNGFLEIVAEKNSTVKTTEDMSRVAIVKFAGDSRNGTNYANYQNNIGNEMSGSDNYTQVVRDLAVVNASNLGNDNDNYNSGTWKGAINALNQGGATAADYGMGYAQAILNKYPIAEGSDRKQIVVMFTDGEPNHFRGFYGSVAATTVNSAKNMKANDVVVYSIAVLDGADPTLDPTVATTSDVNKYLHAVSSNFKTASATGSETTDYWGTETSHTFNVTWGERTKKEDGTNKDHYFTASSSAQLANIFAAIAEESGSTTTEVDAESVLKDIVSGSFTLPPEVLASEHPEDAITVKIVRWDSSKHEWGTGNDFVFTPEQWKTASTNYGAKVQEEVGIEIDEKDVNITGFDYATHYKATTKEQDTDELDPIGGVNKNTAKVVISFEIDAKPSAVTGGSINTNGEMSGIYLNPDDKEPLLKFPQPKVVFTPITFVVDYVNSDTGPDTKASTVELDYSGVLKNVEMLDDPTDDILKGETLQQFTYKIYQAKYGTISFGEDADEVQEKRYVRYAPTTMNWNDYDRIFIKGKSLTDNDLNVWAMLAVVPATSVFYEDTFITTSKHVDYGEEGVDIQYTGINYSGDKGADWALAGAEGGNTTQHAKDNMGWVDGLQDDTTYANGAAHTTSKAKAKATFTFSGTGVDIYSRTNGSTGTVAVNIKGNKDENGKAQLNKTKTIDTKAASGDYYAIPVCTFTDLPYAEYTVTITVTTGGKAEGRMTFYLDGVRVYNPIQPLEETDEVVKKVYGPENLGAVFTEVRSLLGGKAEVAEVYYIDEHTTEEIVTDLDAIEAAAQELAAAQAAREKYVEENVSPVQKVLNAAKVLLDKRTRELNKAQNDYASAQAAGASAEELAALQAKIDAAQAAYDDAEDAVEEAQGPVNAALEGKVPYDEAVEAAVDKYDLVNDGVKVRYTTEELAEYQKEGPKSEVLLSSGQQVAINVESGKTYYIGLRSLYGDAITVLLNGTKEVDLLHTADLYYEVTPTSDVITVKNVTDGNGILSVTKLRTSGAGNKSAGTRLASAEETMNFVRSLKSMPVSEYTGEVLTEEEAPAEEPEAEVIETINEEAIIIEEPEPAAVEPVAEKPAETETALSRILSSFFRFFRR